MELKFQALSSVAFRSLLLMAAGLVIQSCNTEVKDRELPVLKISGNHRYLAEDSGDPFFWLGDTGWLLFTKLNREEAGKYLEDRRLKGFNVIQVIVLHNIRNAVNVYGDSALRDDRIEMPVTTPGNSFSDSGQYDFWDHVDYIIDLAAAKGLYMALVPVWGSNVRGGGITREQAAKYAGWIAERYSARTNLIWLNGGDVRGSDSTAIWNIIGNTIREVSGNQLITYHPFGRTQSSEWFHNESWLDFNMFQSGHRRYDQDTANLAYGEDNWRYANKDLSLFPVKPTLDGEPSYEGIPQGLHDTAQPLWNDKDVRRYAYWSVFAGCCGFTYGHSSIIQFYRPGDDPAYGARQFWNIALDAPGAAQMRYLRQLMLSRPYFERIPAQELISQGKDEKYNYIAVTRGEDYLFAYTCDGHTFRLNLDKLDWHGYKASWFDPRTGSVNASGKFRIPGSYVFDPPGIAEPGNDWVLILDRI